MMDTGSEMLLAPVCVPVSPDCVSLLSGYVARRLSLTTLDPPPTVAGSYLLHPRKSPEQEEEQNEQQNEPSPQRKRKRKLFVSEHKVSTKRRISEPNELDDLSRYSTKAFGDLFTSTVREVHQLKERLNVFDFYNKLGTSRSVAAADMVESAVISLGFSLRQVIAQDIERKKISRDHLFGPSKTFWRGDLRDVNYTACWWWFVKSTERSLADFWRKAGYKGEVLSIEWYNPFKGKQVSRDCSLLLRYMMRAEEDFSKLVHLTKEQVQFCIGLFLCGPKLDRNKDVHLFGLWEVVRGSKIDHHGSHQSCAFDLSAVEKESLSPKLMDFSIEQLSAKKFVLNDLITHLDELPSYYRQQATEIRAIASFLWRELSKACGRAVRKAIAGAIRPSVAEIFSLPGTYLKWTEGFDGSDGHFYVSLCKQEGELSLAISNEGLWWKFVEGKWIEVLDAPNEVLSG